MAMIVVVMMPIRVRVSGIIVALQDIRVGR